MRLAPALEFTRWLIERCFDGQEIAVAFMPKPEAA
jgi:hypothetical protein